MDEELDSEMLNNIDLLLNMDVLEEEDNWDLAEESDVSIDELSENEDLDDE